MMSSIKNNRGQILVLVAVSLVVLLGFAALAIDIGYFYHTKNQLQGAADAAALAGASELQYGSTSQSQPLARQEAWKFACKNRAAGQNVYLVTSGTNCDSPPAVSGLNDNNSNPTGDIVLGNWNGFNFSSNSTTTVNAIQVTSRLSGTSNNPNKPVGTFFGKIFGVSNVTVATSAIALAPTSPKVGTFPLCSNACNMKTLLPTGLQFSFNASPYTAWTSWSDNQTNKNTSLPYFNNPKLLPTKYCDKQAYVTQGVVNSTFTAVIAVVSSSTYSATYVVKGISIGGYKVLIPIFNDCNTSTYNPGATPDPHTIGSLAEVIITKVTKQGGGGDNLASIYVVGTGTDAAGCPTCTANESYIKCYPCDSSGSNKMDMSTLVK